MKKRLTVGTLCAGLAFLAATVFASPINLPTAVKEQAGLQLKDDSSWEGADEERIDKIFQEMGFSAGFLNDYVGERKLNKYSSSVSFDMIGGKMSLSILKNFDIYTILGGMLSPGYKANILGEDIKADLSNNFMWGIGASAILYDWKDVGMQLFGDGNYRAATDIGFDSATANGVTVSKSDLDSIGAKASAKWQEWQTALGVSKKFQYFVPYGGLVYSDVKASAKLKVSGIVYNPGSLSSKNKIGPFIGVSILPTKWLSIDVTGRFVAEEAVSVAATVKF